MSVEWTAGEALAALERLGFDPHTVTLNSAKRDPRGRMHLGSCPKAAGWFRGHPSEMPGLSLVEARAQRWCRSCATWPQMVTHLGGAFSAASWAELLEDIRVRAYVASPLSAGPVAVSARLAVLRRLRATWSTAGVQRSIVDVRAFTNVALEREVTRLERLVRSDDHRQALSDVCRAGSAAGGGEALLGLVGYSPPSAVNASVYGPLVDTADVRLLDAVVEAFAVEGYQPDLKGAAALRCPMDVAIWVWFAAAAARLKCTWGQLPTVEPDQVAETALGMWKPGESDNELAEMEAAVEMAANI